MATMSSLCTLDVLQNGGITSGIDMFLNVFFGLCKMVQRFLLPKFMDKNFNGYFRNTLAACFAFASEFGRLWCNFVFLDVHDVFDNWIDSFQQQLSPKSRWLRILSCAIYVKKKWGIDGSTPFKTGQLSHLCP